MTQNENDTIEVVINTCFGGFSLSTEAVEWMRERGYPAGDRCKLAGEEYDDGSGRVGSFVAPTVPRHDEEFRTAEGVVAVVKELGDAADGKYSDLEVVEIPSDVGWHIDEYDGNESIHETHRTWR